MGNHLCCHIGELGIVQRHCLVWREQCFSIWILYKYPKAIWMIQYTSEMYLLLSTEMSKSNATVVLPGSHTKLCSIHIFDFDWCDEWNVSEWAIRLFHVENYVANLVEQTPVLQFLDTYGLTNKLIMTYFCDELPCEPNITINKSSEIKSSVSYRLSPVPPQVRMVPLVPGVSLMLRSFW